MVKLENTTLVRYEFDAYIHALDSTSEYKVCNILLTEDDLVTMGSQSAEINWIKVEKINVIDIEEIGNNSVAETKKRICGIFETKPIFWTYAKIIINDNTNTKRCNAIAKMPRSPVVPVIFDVKGIG
jgi:hypothetical protein